MDATRQPSVNGTPLRLAYGVQETARLLGVCHQSIRRFILRDLLRPSRALRHIGISTDEVERFLRDTR